jgi:hypothetical protein
VRLVPAALFARFEVHTRCGCNPERTPVFGNQIRGLRGYLFHFLVG